MDISLRSALTAGVTAVAASAVVFAPSVTPPPQEETTKWLPVRLSAAVTAPVEPTLNAIENIAPSLFTPVPTPGAVVQPQNAASNIIDSVYSVSRYWANYVALDLGPWLIGWIPFGYLINDQIFIWYPTFVLPVVDSFVYQFLDPVVNDPLNVNAWVGGLNAIANTAINGAISGVQQEINYLLSLQWLPFPIPPLPPWPFAATASTFAQDDAAVTLAGALRGALTAVSDRLSEASADLVDAKTAVADRIDGAVDRFQNVAGGLLPQAGDATFSGLTDPGAFSLKAPRLQLLRTESEATESTSSADEDSTPVLTAVKERVAKPRTVLREAFKAEPGGASKATAAKDLSDGVKKATKSVQNAGKSIRAAVQDKLKKATKSDAADKARQKDTDKSE